MSCSSRLFVEMFGGENETSKASDVEEEIGPSEVVGRMVEGVGGGLNVGRQ